MPSGSACTQSVNCMQENNGSIFRLVCGCFALVPANKHTDGTQTKPTNASKHTHTQRHSLIHQLTHTGKQKESYINK